MDIFLNGEKVTVTPGRGSKPGARMTVSYELLAELAGLAGRCPSISWRMPETNGASGLLTQKERVQLVEGMRFDVGVTGAA